MEKATVGFFARGLFDGAAAIRSNRRADEDGVVCRDRPTQGRIGLASRKVRSVAVGERREWIGAGHSELSIVRQCQLTGLSRSGLYYQPRGESELNLELMRLLDEQYTRTPFFGVPKMTRALRDRGYVINPKRVRRLLRQMGLEAIYPKPRLSKPAPGPTDLSLPAAQCCHHATESSVVQRYHVYSTPCRFHLSGRRHRLVQPLCAQLGNIDEPGFGILLLGAGPRAAPGRPEIFNTDQGAQCTSDAFTSRLEAENILIGMDGRGRALDNVFVERLWRTVKYEDVYLKDYSDPPDAVRNLGPYFKFYNAERPHQALGFQTPDAVYRNAGKKTRRPLRGNFS